MRREKMSKFLRIFAPSFLMSSREKNIGFFIIFTLMFHISSVHINENHESKPICFCILHARRHGRSIVMVGHKRIYDGDA